MLGGGGALRAEGDKWSCDVNPSLWLAVDISSCVDTAGAGVGAGISAESCAGDIVGAVGGADIAEGGGESVFQT